MIHSTPSQHRQRLFLWAILLITGCSGLTARAGGKYEPPGNAVYHGAGLSDYWSEDGLRQQVQRYERLSGKNLAIITWFASQYEHGRTTSWRREYSRNLHWVQKVGSVSLIKFSTCDSAFSKTRKSALPRSIAHGGHNAYFREFADTIKDFGGPVFISINHEMNGNWYPYSQDYPGTNTSAAEYIAMWRHIVNVFRQRGANNVAWVWAPNVPDVGRTPATAYYPGDAYVDWIGPSFYSGNQTNAMDALYRTYAPRKPFFITEWATSPQQNRYNPAFPGEAQWVAQFFGALQQRYPRVKAISWFQWDKNDGNCLLERVSGQRQAYVSQVRDPRFLGDARRLMSLAYRSTPRRNTAARVAEVTTPARPSSSPQLRLSITGQRNVAIQR